MADTDLSLVNAALTRTGNEPISALDGNDSATAIIANENYELLVKAELARSRFKLPSKFTQLSLINETEMGEPPEPWQYGYTLPTDLVKLRTITVSGVPIPFIQVGRIIFCDYDNTNEVIAHYLWRIPESWFAPEFALGITFRMEAVFLRAFEQHKEAAERDDAAYEQLLFAASSDAQSQAPTDPVTSPALSARTGSGPTALSVRRG
jgi:hypothetical protein